MIGRTAVNTHPTALCVLHEGIGCTSLDTMEPQEDVRARRGLRPRDILAWEMRGKSFEQSAALFA
jgi:hypothetical protein